MGTSKGYYSLVQYCPDLLRMEAANIGVLLFSPDRQFLQAKMTSDNSRIRQFFGSESNDWQRINSFKKGFVERLEAEQGVLVSLEDLQRFVATRANEFQLTPPRPMKVNDPRADLERLFSDLFGEEHGPEGRANLKRYLSKRFDSAGILDRIRKDVPVTVPAFNRQISVPYAYQNGRLNLIQPVRFESRAQEQAVVTACKYAVEGRSLYAHPDPSLGGLQLVVVGKFRTQEDETRDVVRRVLDENDVRLFSLPELPALIEEIKTTGKLVAD
jgi:hypothetical protein